jgi:4-amino-4-deoxy-L-arabinose transferase-like glycosyltransferase
VAGDTPLGIRLCAVLTALLGPLILWRSAHILFGSTRAARRVVALAMPLMAVGGVIITPDTASVLFWGLAAWALAELLTSRNANWWLAVGLFAGLGLLSKYTNLFVGAGILLWLVWGPGNLRWLRSWQLWAGGAIASLLTLPVVVWNAQHEWASFGKQFGRAARGQGWTLTYLAGLIGGFVGLASPLIALLALVGLARAVSLAARERDALHSARSGSCSAARLLPGACAA